MNQNYSINSFEPTDTVLTTIKQFAYTFKTITVAGVTMPFCLN